MPLVAMADGASVPPSATQMRVGRRYRIMVRGGTFGQIGTPAVQPVLTQPSRSRENRLERSSDESSCLRS
jgi:hypothetical protein